MNEHTTKISIAGGFLTVFFGNINSADLLKTIIMSATGTIISFVISISLNAILKRLRK